MSIPRLLIAGQSSGAGKTLITLGIEAALRRRGLIVQPFKCGPDYIDPTYHTAATGRDCRNLDTWMLSPEQVLEEFDRACRGADIAVIEGVMGLFDGSSYVDDTGSSAHIAHLLQAPVLLILDIGKMARSAGAVALGFRSFAAQINLAGVILNRAGSESHAKGCREAIAQAANLPTFGWLPKESGLHIPERHLGLVPTDERTEWENLIDAAADAVDANFALDRILSIARFSSRQRQQRCTNLATKHGGKVSNKIEAHKSVRIAVARDKAFSFYYPANLDLLVESGAEIVFFSPLHDESLPPDVAGLYLGGGFPEVYVSKLSQNQLIWQSIADFHASGYPIYAECGGLMVLTEAIVDLDKHRWPFCGIVPGETRMQPKLVSLGYRVAEAISENVLLNAGDAVRGHEFHYSTWHTNGTSHTLSPAWRLRRRQEHAEWRPAGYVDKNLLASYLHIHFGQDPRLAQRYVERCRQPI